MEISNFEKQQVLKTLTRAELEDIITQIVQKVISRDKKKLIPDEYKQDTPFDSKATPFWQIIVEDSHKIPEEIWSSIPNDASENISLK